MSFFILNLTCVRGSPSLSQIFFGVIPTFRKQFRMKYTDVRYFFRFNFTIEKMHKNIIIFWHVRKITFRCTSARMTATFFGRGTLQ